jgi:hypothetical protein
MSAPHIGRFLWERFVEGENGLRVLTAPSDASVRLARLERDRQIAVMCMAYIKEEQGDPPAVPRDNPVSSLGGGAEVAGGPVRRPLCLSGELETGSPAMNRTPDRRSSDADR